MTVTADIPTALRKQGISRLVQMQTVYVVGTGRRLYWMDLDDSHPNYDNEPIPAEYLGGGIKPNLVSSLREDGMHVPTLDLDIPATLIPSSTPGHSHLYIEAPMTKRSYMALLSALADFGIIEDGYYHASVARDASYLRLPHIRKKVEG